MACSLGGWCCYRIATMGPWLPIHLLIVPLLMWTSLVGVFFCKVCEAILISLVYNLVP